MVRLGVAFDLFAYSTNVFQFQYGSIGRCISMIYAKDSFGFNSSMVRLGDWHPVNRNSEIRGFNSSMVRLGETRLLYYLYCDYLFQFQYGSIGRTK